MRAKQQEKDKPKDLIVKHNALINSRYQLSLNEMRLLLYVISSIKPQDEDFKKYRINLDDFITNIDSNSNAFYEIARNASKDLMSKVLELPQQDGCLQVSWLSSAKYYHGKGYVDLSFDPSLKPYLLKVKERYTKYERKNVR